MQHREYSNLDASPLASGRGAEGVDDVGQNTPEDWFNNGEYFYNKKDYTEAVKWYRKAAEQGDAEAQDSLGVMYAKGMGVAQDDTEAVKWWRKAAEQGHAQAQFYLGLAYCKGDGVAQNYTKAVKWTKKAADQGLPYAYAGMGKFYFEGAGVTKDLETSKYWYKKALDKGNETVRKEAREMLDKIEAAQRGY